MSRILGFTVNPRHLELLRQYLELAKIAMESEAVDQDAPDMEEQE